MSQFAAQANQSGGVLETIITLRVVVGYLGERAQFGWWQSAFFAPASSAFLRPLFARTQLFARCSGVTQAAALVHDERIGVGNVYHLFRLPEDLEQMMHRALQNTQMDATLLALVVDQQTAQATLRKLAVSTNEDAVGPTWVGATAALRDDHSWRRVAGYCTQAFARQREIFPYFADRST